MKIKINQPILRADGSQLMDDQSIPKVAITFKEIAINSILAPIQGDDEKKKYEKYEIFRKLKNVKAEEVDLKTEELNLLKAAIGKVQPPLIMGQCWDMIEGKG